MITRADVVTEARSWLGTPFMEQTARKGIGVDCVQLIFAVPIALGLFPAGVSRRGTFPQFAAYSHAPGAVPEDDFLREFEALCDPARVDELLPGTVVMMLADSRPATRKARLLHWAIVGDYRHGGASLIHCTLRGVIEHRLPLDWQPLIQRAFSYPGIHTT